MPKRQRRRWFLKQWRNHRGLTQEQLADRVGVTQGLISQLENNRTDYTGALLEALADALLCDPQDLLMRDPSRPDAMWSILDNLKRATPEEQEQISRVSDALLRRTGS